MERDEYRRMAALEGVMWWYRALHAGLCQRLAALDLPAGSRLLDAGSGTGGLLRQLEKSFPGYQLYGLEYDAEAMAFADARSNMRGTIGSVNALPFHDNSFDVVVSADVLCHARADEAAALAEFKRCLKPGGHVLLNLPAYSWMKSTHDAHVHNVRRYTGRGAARLLRSSGFTVEAFGYWNSLLFPLMLVHRLIGSQDSETSDVRPFHPWADRLFFFVTALERRLARYGLNFPFGGSVWALGAKTG